MATPTTSYYILNMFISFPYEHTFIQQYTCSIGLVFIYYFFYSVYTHESQDENVKMENLNFQKIYKIQETHKITKKEEDEDNNRGRRRWKLCVCNK